MYFLRSPLPPEFFFLSLNYVSGLGFCPLINRSQLTFNSYISFHQIAFSSFAQFPNPFYEKSQIFPADTGPDIAEIYVPGQHPCCQSDYVLQVNSPE